MFEPVKALLKPLDAERALGLSYGGFAFGDVRQRRRAELRGALEPTLGDTECFVGTEELPAEGATLPRSCPLQLSRDRETR